MAEECTSLCATLAFRGYVFDFCRHVKPVKMHLSVSYMLCWLGFSHFVNFVIACRCTDETMVVLLSVMLHRCVSVELDGHQR